MMKTDSYSGFIKSEFYQQYVVREFGIEGPAKQQVILSIFLPISSVSDAVFPFDYCCGNIVMETLCKGMASSIGRY